MKITRLLIAWSFVIALIAGAVWGSFELKARLNPEPAEAGKDAEKEAPDHALADKLGLITQPLAAATWTPQISAQARVIDPTPLVTLINDLSTADAALKAAEAELQRSRQLFQSGENIARKTLEQAEAQALTERLRAQGLRQQLSLAWGAVLMNDGEAMSAALAAGEKVLIRAELPSVTALDQEPASAQVTLPGKATAVIPAARLIPAPTVDARTQTRAFFLVIDKPPAPMPPGLILNATMSAPGAPVAGVLIPQAALLYFQGAAWVYLAQDGEAAFVRKPVSVQRPQAGGFFVNEGFRAGERVVTTGAAYLLADELKTQIEAD